jgi:hypothetical protein
MSADNGYIIRKRWNSKTVKPEFVLQMYFASDDELPPINIAHADNVFDTLHDAVIAFSKLDSGDYPSEYGLRVDIERLA